MQELEKTLEDLCTRVDRVRDQNFRLNLENKVIHRVIYSI